MKSLLIILVAGLLSLSASSQVNKVSSGSKSLEQQLNEEYCTGLFKTTEGTILDVASSNSVKGYMNILDWLQGRVAGLQIYTSRTGTSIPVIRGSVPGIYVDEISVSASYLNMINVNDIAMVKIIKTPFFGGFNGSGGAIAIYTLGKEEEEEEETK
jgi:TonB-dependent Receptor Plug Domain